ncbi:uncharacterized protein GGS25DRAFT_86681 [Hypoxylon fragiforme]|uniref:uncharacterized protein n=1 Tax=Hypoxylon fragiforme TaxID=63214 RepID=UPI0020C6EF24|nr:uncharacterized protein GGS25DRAFT_86681 [Hypoxylon fragiforme]KAI2603274.1 hypothetical protein GGS25DRAFT_86681 [Hypoxylon fragiforme]
MRRVLMQTSTFPRLRETPPLSRIPSHRSVSSQSHKEGIHSQQDEHVTSTAEKEKVNEKRKTVAELDAELRLKMSGLSGDGGAAGVEYEDGQPVAMKRSVKNNMFRYI